MADSTADAIEAAKREAARHAIDQHVNAETRVVGVGSGSTIVYAAERLGELFRGDGGLDFVCIPTGFQARALIVEHGLVLADLDTHPAIDVAFDGADEVDANLDLIKGGGGCHLEEKLVASNAAFFVVVADDRKDSAKLGEKWRRGVPIEILGRAYRPIKNKLEAKYGVEAVLREGSGKAGPVVTDNGNFVLDVDFGEIDDPASLFSDLIEIPGVLEVGIFAGMADVAYFGTSDGTVRVRESPTKRER